MLFVIGHWSFVFLTADILFGDCYISDRLKIYKAEAIAPALLLLLLQNLVKLNRFET